MSHTHLASWNLKGKVLAMKRISGYIRLAAYAALVPFSALAGGHILRMDSTSSFPATAPARIGSEVTFRMILANHTRSSAYDTPWVLKYMGAGSEAFDFGANPPMVAIMIGGQERYASLVRVKAYGESSCLTEMDFSYAVKPGDMAEPMTVVCENGAPKFKNLGLGRMWDIRTYDNTQSADLTFRGSGEAVDGVAVNQNYSLLAAADELGEGPAYIKTVDFDSSTVEVDGGRYWRSVEEGTETTSSEPKIVIEGGAAAANGTVYVWISDETGTNVSETVGFGTGMTLDGPNAFGQMVLPVTFAAGDTEKTFSLRGLSADGTGSAYVYLGAARGNSLTSDNQLVPNFTYRVVKVTGQELPPPPPPIVSNVVVRQQWPWNGLVDIDYEIGGDSSGLAVKIDVAERPKFFAATTFVGDAPSAEPGKHRVTWNAKADGATNVVAEVIATIKLLRPGN